MDNIQSYLLDNSKNLSINLKNKDLSADKNIPAKTSNINNILKATLNKKTEYTSITYSILNNKVSTSNKGLISKHNKLKDEHGLLNKNKDNNYFIILAIRTQLQISLYVNKETEKL